MTKEQKNKEFYDISFDKIVCDHMENSDELNVILFPKEDNNYSNLLSVLDKYPGYKVNINNVYSVKTYNSVINTLRNNKYDGDIIINLISSYNNLEDLNNYDFLELDFIPDNVKVKGFLPNNAQNNFSTWAHNLPGVSRESLSNILVDEDKEAFNSQEEVIEDYYKLVMKPFRELKDDSESILKSVTYHIEKRYSVKQESVTERVDWANDPVEVYKRQEGTDFGRANLLTLLTNNHNLGVKCTLVNGYYVKEKDAIYPNHTWNELTDFYGNITHYDLSTNQVGVSDKDLTDHMIMKEYPSVKALRKDNKNDKVLNLKK